MPIQLSGSLVITGSITTTGVITMSGSIASATSASYSSTSDLLQGTGSVGFATTASLLTVSSSQQQISASQQQISSSLLRISSSYASTGSNTFTGIQNFSNTCTPNSFTAGASIYTAGGLQVTQDTYFSSSVYIKGNVTVYGTQSVSYVSSSQFNIGTNIITVNTFTPSVRYGGLSVFDSGSTGLTGSIFWDSELNRWIYVNASGSGGGDTYGGGMFISGPRNTQGIGCEQGTTACMLLVGQGGDHLTSSMIYHSSTVTCVPNNLIGSTICSTMVNASCIGIGTTSPATPLHLTTSLLPAIRLTLGSEARVHNISGVNNGRDLNISPFRHFSVQTGNGITEGQIVLNAYEDFIVGTGASYTPRLTIASTGAATFSSSIGINTSPSYKLDVLGPNGDWTARIKSDATTGAGYGLLIDAGTNGTDESLRIRTATGGSTLMVVKGSGNVGIGSTAPTGTLTIQKTTMPTGYTVQNSYLHIGGTNEVLNGTALINFGYADGCTYTYAPAYIGFVETVYTGGEKGDLVFGTRDVTTSTQPTERMRITSGGNVGIDTSNPLADLQVSRTGEVVIAMGNNGSITSGNRGTLAWYNSADSTVAIIRATAVTDNVGTQLEFYTRPAAGSLAQKMILNSSGRLLVGGGVTDSGASIQTNGDIRADYSSGIYLEINGGAAGDYRKGFSGVNQQTGVARGLHIFNYDPDSSQGIKFFGGTYAAKVRFGGFDSGGNFFVNATDSAEGYKLYVNGTVGITGAATFSSNISNSGNLITYKSGGGGNPKQVVVGQITAAASGTAKKIAYVGHTHAVRVYVWASQSASHGSTAIADITTLYGSSNGGITTEANFGNVSDTVIAYDNGGSPAYTINVTLVYTGTAPTINYIVEGINNDNSIYAI